MNLAHSGDLYLLNLVLWVRYGVDMDRSRGRTFSSYNPFGQYDAWTGGYDGTNLVERSSELRAQPVVHISKSVRLFPLECHLHPEGSGFPRSFELTVYICD